MRFIDRENEIKLLEEARELSKRKLYSVCIFGPRRVGKTRLVLEFIRDTDLYFFVNKDKTSESLLHEFQETLRERNIIGELEVIDNWDKFFKVIFERFNGVIVFDEFQNFKFVDPSVFGTLQKFIDLYKNRRNLLIIFCGSLIGLVKKMFSRKEPLYGRVKRKLRLRPLSISGVYEMCKELKLSFETTLKLYSIFGGFPRYYVAIEDENLEGKPFEKIIEKFFLVENATFEDEVNTILSMEFGKRKGLYYDILCAVAAGCRRISEIASFLQRRQTSITRQLSELIREFEYLTYEEQVLGKKRLLKISHPLINFWMRFFYRNYSLYVQRNPIFIAKFKREINTYLGERFEEICRELFPKLAPIKYTKLGKHWGKSPLDGSTYEIDILAVNEKTNEILFAECKWAENVDAEKIVKKLAKIAEYVRWNADDRIEHFAVFAKSFSKSLKNFDGRKVFCYSLRDLEKALVKTRNTGS